MRKSHKIIMFINRLQCVHTFDIICVYSITIDSARHAATDRDSTKRRAARYRAAYVPRLVCILPVNTSTPDPRTPRRALHLDKYTPETRTTESKPTRYATPRHRPQLTEPRRCALCKSLLQDPYTSPRTPQRQSRAKVKRQPRNRAAVANVKTRASTGTPAALV